MHAPLERKGALVPLHVMQSLAVGPLHVPQLEWHASHTPLLLAYLPTGVHVARQLPRRVPRMLKKGVAAAHDKQSLAVVPSHSAQLASHATHVSAEVELPPAHV